METTVDENVVNIESNGDNGNKPYVFTPETFDKEKLKKQIEKDQAGKILARSYRMVIIIFVPFFLFILLAVERQTVSIISVFGYGLLFMYIGYGIHIFLMFGRGTCNGHSLYRVYSINGAPTNWSYMLITYRQIVFPFHPITSISEFSAIGGGLAHDMLLAISSYNWAILLCGIAVKFQSCGAFTGDDIVVLIGGFGLALIGTFELDPFNNTMQTIHTTGAALGLGTVVAYTWQTVRYATLLSECSGATLARLWSPILLDIIAVVGFIGWRISHCKADKYGASPGPKESKTVSKLTLLCVTFEAIFLYSGAISECLWLIFHDFYPTCNGVSTKPYACFTPRD
mmetsp:Transcript_65415/g.80088  ORF Transcript_65415/g.80088 Transcript_65415/m.80088 type:complete len:342 (+) Transcript_65415:63-1088(+)